MAVAHTLLDGGSCADRYRNYHRDHPHRGYGASFRAWARKPAAGPYGSWGNGAAMRISPVGHASEDLDTVLRQAEAFTVVTHDHPEAVKGAQAVAGSVLLARKGASKAEIKAFVETSFGYDLDRSLDELRPGYRFDVSCQGTVPQALRAFLEAEDFEDALRNAVSLGGDSDTLACIAGGLAEAFYGGVPEPLAAQVFGLLDERLATITRRFRDRYCP